MIYHGRAAVEAVEKGESRKLSPEEERVVLCEGYATEPYFDTKRILTHKVGQTGEWLDKTFKEAFDHHVERVRRRLPQYDKYPEFLRCELMQAEYRGDLGLSPKAVAYLKDGRYRSSAEEFLNNAEYKNPNTSVGIKKRLEALHYALMLIAVRL